MRPYRLVATIGLLGIVSAGCAAATPASVSPGLSSAAPSGPPASPQASPSQSGSGWVTDLATIDQRVRADHPEPFAIHPESEWTAMLAALETSLPVATPDEQVAQLQGLVGLLDTHSGMDGPSHIYPIRFYRFPEGWFVVRARDESLVGSRLVAIGETPVDDVEAMLHPLAPADNETGKLLAMQYLLGTVELLHGLGLVDDPAKPGLVLERPDGSRVTVDPAPELPDDGFGLETVGSLEGDANEAVARRAEPVWTRIDKASKTFVLSYNDYTETDLQPALEAMDAALDDGSAERVVIDMRYLQGGNGSLASPLIEAVKSDDRINRPGGLSVLIGRENFSAGTVVAGALDRETEGVLIGEPTPARADGFLCPCSDITLHSSPYVITIPTDFLANGDTRDAVMPDIPLDLTAADFFAGKDPALELALSGAQPTPSP